jgi:hypothetical protein
MTPRFQEAEMGRISERDKLTLVPLIPQINRIAERGNAGGHPSCVGSVNRRIPGPGLLQARLCPKRARGGGWPSSRAPAWQVQGPEFIPQYRSKKEKKKSLRKFPQLSQTCQTDTCHKNGSELCIPAMGSPGKSCLGLLCL